MQTASDVIQEMAYKQGRADVINEIYAKFMNEDKDSILEWLQDNITD